MKISNFINTGMRDYANYDNYRSLPHLMDGLKVTQRKLLCAFVENIGYQTILCDKAGMRAAEITKYHHGAVSMIGVLVNMNQDFVGSNNLPLFEKDGQFGNRLNHEASSERYISTKLSDAYKKLFDTDDNFILESQYDDGDKIEPKYYLPKLPLLLINGSQGTGNGYKTSVLTYDAEEIKQAVSEVLKGGLVETKLTPFMKGFNGGISKDHVSGQVTFEGTITRKGSNQLIISELPPSMQLKKYREHLNTLMEKQKNGDAPYIKDYDNESTEDEWRFIIDCPRSTSLLSDDKLMEIFKLIERDTETLVAWLPNGKLKRFASVENMIEDWVALRLEFYESRRLNKIERMSVETTWLNAKLNFILWWNEDSSNLVKLKKTYLKEAIKAKMGISDEFIDRLLAIRISNLGLDELNELKAEIAKIQTVIEKLQTTTNKKMMAEEIKNIKL